MCLPFISTYSQLTFSRGLAKFGLLPPAKLVRPDGQEADIALGVTLAILALIQKVFWDRRNLDHLTRKSQNKQFSLVNKTWSYRAVAAKKPSRGTRYILLEKRVFPDTDGRSATDIYLPTVSYVQGRYKVHTIVRFRHARSYIESHIDVFCKAHALIGPPVPSHVPAHTRRSS